MRNERKYIDYFRKAAIMKEHSDKNRSEYYEVMQFADTLDSKLTRVLLKVMKGKSNKEIAYELDYSEQTACRLLDKLNKEAEDYYERRKEEA